MVCDFFNIYIYIFGDFGGRGGGGIFDGILTLRGGSV